MTKRGTLRRALLPSVPVHSTIRPRVSQKRLGANEQDFVAPTDAKRKVGELFKALRLDYENNERKSWADVEARWRLHLEPVFGTMCALSVEEGDLARYQNDRRKAGADNGTINRELAVLRRMFTLGKIVKPRGFFPKLKENPARKGFVEDDEYGKLAAGCAREGLWMRALFEAGYQLGWRVSEFLAMRVRQVDLSARVLRLDPGTTKNDEGRETAMPERLFLLIQQCVTGKAPADFVFTRENGKPVRDFRRTWAKIRFEAGKPDLLFHDLRRSAVRNMDRRGISQTVAMTITGHRIPSVYKRYRIVNEADLQEAARRMEQPANRYSLTTVAPSAVQATNDPMVN